MIAIAIANDPDLLICDEPTTALDVTVQAQILEVLQTARDVTGAGVLIITHDLGVVAEFADRALVMYAGRAVEAAAGRRALPRPPDALHRRAFGLGAATRRPAGQPAGADSRRAAVAGEPAAGLPVRPALPAGHRRLPRRRTGAAADGRGPRRGLHPHRAGHRTHRGRDLRRVHRSRSIAEDESEPEIVVRVRDLVEDLPADQGRGVPPPDRRGARRRRHQLRPAAGPHARHRRRVRLREVDHPARDPGTDRAAVRFHRSARQRRRHPDPGAPPRAAPRPAGGVPGSGGRPWIPGYRSSTCWQNR